MSRKKFIRALKGSQEGVEAVGALLSSLGYGVQIDQGYDPDKGSDKGDVRVLIGGEWKEIDVKFKISKFKGNGFTSVDTMFETVHVGNCHLVDDRVKPWAYAVVNNRLTHVALTWDMDSSKWIVFKNLWGKDGRSADTYSIPREHFVVYSMKDGRDILAFPDAERARQNQKFFNIVSAASGLTFPQGEET